MTWPLSYYTVGTASFVLSYFGGIFERSGFVVALFITAFFAIFRNNGLESIGSPPYEMTSSFYFESEIAVIACWSFAGSLLCRALNNMKFLNNFTIVIAKKKEQQTNRSGNYVAFWFFLLIFFGSLVIWELEDFVYFGRTFCSVGLTLVAWLMFYFLYKDETVFYNNDGKPDGKTTRAIVFTLTWIPALILFVYGLTYLLLEYFAQKNFPPLSSFGTQWFTNHWNFYFSLIFAAVAAIVAFALQTMEWNTRKKHYRHLEPDQTTEWIQLGEGKSVKMRSVRPGDLK